MNYKCTRGCGIINSLFKELKEVFLRLCKNAANLVYGTKRLERMEADYVSDKILNSNLIRLFPFIFVIMLLEITNIVVDQTTNAHPGFTKWFLLLAISILAICMVALILICVNYMSGNDLKHKKIIYMGFWYLFSIATLGFTVIDIIERSSLNNYIMLSAAIAFVPLLSFPQAFILTLINALLEVMIIQLTTGEVFLMQQSIMVALFSCTISQILFTSYISSNSTQYKLKKSNEALQILSQTDPLTNVFNRRGMENCLNLHLNDNPESHIIMLGIIDIDFFKKYNDKYGHLNGDICLKRVAESLKFICYSEKYTITRFGGEEFALISYDSDAEEFIIIADNIRSKIESLKIPAGDTNVSEYLTVSIGISQLEINAETDLSLIFTEADMQLYKAKSDGRNCIYFNDNKQIRGV